MYTNMEFWTRTRLDVLRGEVSKREILRREGIHWETLKKILDHSEPPGYRMDQPRPKPKMGPFLEQIAQIIETDKQFPKKQRWLPFPDLLKILSKCARPLRIAEIIFAIS